jgi:DNA-binding MarR family transcriptional regulator
LSATRLARQLRQESDAGLSPSQLSALATIERCGSLTLGALAEQERVAPPSVTKVVAKLEAAGLVVRTLDEHDRRVAWVSTTTAGSTRLARIRQRKNVWLAARLAELDDDQRRRLADALDVLDTLTADPQ